MSILYGKLKSGGRKTDLFYAFASEYRHGKIIVEKLLSIIKCHFIQQIEKLSQKTHREIIMIRHWSTIRT